MAAKKKSIAYWEEQAKGWSERAREAEAIADQTQAQLVFYASQATHDVLMELAHAQRQFKAFNSAHEGFAVLKEEVDELWEEVRMRPGEDPTSKKVRLAAMREEAVQVAAMALRFIKEVCDKEFVD